MADDVPSLCLWSPRLPVSNHGTVEEVLSDEVAAPS